MTKNNLILVVIFLEVSGIFGHFRYLGGYFGRFEVSTLFCSVYRFQGILVTLEVSWVFLVILRYLGQF